MGSLSACQSCFWSLEFGPAATTFLDLLPAGKVRRQIVKKAKTLQHKPFPPGCKKLFHWDDEDAADVWRIRSGDYRILYVVSDDGVMVVDIRAPEGRV